MSEKPKIENESDPDRHPKAHDVARLAGVSRTQVSYVLNNTRTAHVSLKRRELILKAAEELDYHPHSSAQSLRRGFSNEFSIFFPAPYSPRINGMIGVIHERGLENGCMPVQYSFNSYTDGNRKQDVLTKLLSRRPLGMFCALIDIGRKDIELARQKGVEKILVLDIEDHDEFATLHLPIEPVGYLAARHLLSQGHRRIGIVNPADVVQGRSFMLRCAGMMRAMHDYPDAELIVLPWPRKNPRPTLEYAREFVDEFLRRDEQPTGIYCYSDDFALPILSEFNSRGIPVPERFALIGTDDIKYSEMFSPSLTTIRFDSDSLGERAVAMINSLITGKPIEERFNHPLEPILIRRCTT